MNAISNKKGVNLYNSRAPIYRYKVDAWILQDYPGEEMKQTEMC